MSITNVGPDRELVRRIEILFQDAANQLRIYTRGNAVMAGVWDIFAGYPAEFSNWKRGIQRIDEPGWQLNKTRKLIGILNGAGLNAAKKRGYEKDYRALRDYWTTHHSARLTEVLAALKAYENGLDRSYQVERRRRFAERTSDRSEMMSDEATRQMHWNPLSPPPERVRVLEDRGDRLGARKWLINNWTSIKDRTYLIHFIRLVEGAGGSSVDLDQFNRLRESLSDEVEGGLKIVERYFVARVLSQIGEIQAAREQHESNLETKVKSHSLYQLRSQFEVAQLDFRIENFARSKLRFAELHDTLTSIPTAPKELRELRVDVLKFLATFERLHVVFDAPCATVVLRDVEPGSASTCLQYAEQAISLARDAGYVDGCGWGYVASAFAYEGLGNIEQAEKDYAEAAICHADPKAHGGSAVYTQFYHAGMLRRQGDIVAAEQRLSHSEQLMGDLSRAFYRAELLTQRGLIANDAVAAANCHLAAFRILAKSPGFRAMHDWGIVKRMRQACASFECQLEDLRAEPGPTEEAR